MSKATDIPDLTALIFSSFVKNEKDMVLAQGAILGKPLIEVMGNKGAKVLENLYDELAFYQIGQFIEVLNTPCSLNPFNDYNVFGGVDLLDDCFTLSQNVNSSLVSPLRAKIGEDTELVNKYIKLITVSGWMPNSVIVYDKHWRILDGLNRVMALRTGRLNIEKVRLMRFDIDGDKK